MFVVHDITTCTSLHSALLQVSTFHGVVSCFKWVFPDRVARPSCKFHCVFKHQTYTSSSTNLQGLTLLVLELLGTQQIALETSLSINNISKNVPILNTLQQGNIMLQTTLNYRWAIFKYIIHEAIFVVSISISTNFLQYRPSLVSF